MSLKKDGTPQQRANQWTKRREQLDVEGHRKRIKVGALLGLATRIALGQSEATAAQVAALKVVLDKALPTLQAVEQIHSEPAATASESDLLSGLRAIFQAHPGLVQQILGEQARNAAPLQSITPENTPSLPDEQVA